MMGGRLFRCDYGLSVSYDAPDVGVALDGKLRSCPYADQRTLFTHPILGDAYITYGQRSSLLHDS